MFRSSIRLGRLAGIEIAVNYSLFLIAIFVVWQIDFLLSQQIGSTSDTQNLIYGIVTALLFFASILWHELAHSVVALAYKLRVRRIVLYFLGGIAEIEDEPRTAAQEFWIAIVGPISSLILGGLFWLIRLPFDEATAVSIVLYWLGFINIILAVFNMMPGFPLDGGRVLRALIWGMSGNHLTGTRIVSYLGFFVTALIVIAAIISPLYPALGNPLWNLFIAWFIYSASRIHLREAERRDALRGIPIGQLVKGAVALKAEWSLTYAADIIALGSPMSALPVVHDGELVGALSMDLLRALPNNGWGSVRVEQVMQPIHTVPRVEASMDVYDAIRDLNNQNFVLVMNDQRLLGLISLHDLLLFAEQRVRI